MVDIVYNIKSKRLLYNCVARFKDSSSLAKISHKRLLQDNVSIMSTLVV